MRFQSRYCTNRIWWQQTLLIGPKNVHFISVLVFFKFHKSSSGYVSKRVSVQLMMTNYSVAVSRLICHHLLLSRQDKPGNLRKTQHGTGRWSIGMLMSDNDDSDCCDVDQAWSCYCWIRLIVAWSIIGWHLFIFCSCTLYKPRAVYVVG